MKKRQLLCFIVLFIFLFNLISPNIVFAFAVNDIVEEKKEFNPTFDIYYLEDVDINEYIEYINTYGDFPVPQNLGVATQDVMTIGTAIATMINPTYVAVGGAVLVAYLGYKYYEHFKHNIRNDGSLVIDAQLREAFRNILNADAGASETIITSGTQNIPTHFTSTSVGTAYLEKSDVIGYYKSFKGTSNSFIIPFTCTFKVSFVSDICNEIAQKTNSDVFSVTSDSSRYLSNKGHFKPYISFATSKNWGSTVTSAYGGFFDWYPSSIYGRGYIPSPHVTKHYSDFNATKYSSSGVVSATIDIVEINDKPVSGSSVTVNDNVAHEVNMPSTEDILETPKNPVTDTVIPDGTVIKPSTGITDQIIDIPIKDIVNIEIPDKVPEPDPQPEPEPEKPQPEPDTTPDSVTDWTTLFTWIANFFTKLAELFKPLFDYITNFFDFLGDLLKDIFAPVLDFVADFFTKLGDLLKLVLKPLVDFVTNFFVEIGKLLNLIFKPLFDFQIYGWNK